MTEGMAPPQVDDYTFFQNISQSLDGTQSNQGTVKLFFLTYGYRDLKQQLRKFLNKVKLVKKFVVYFITNKDSLNSV